MRMRLAVGILALAVTVASGMPDRAGAQTLADTLVAAYRNSNLLEQNRALLRATDEDVVQARAELLPVVQFITGAQANRRRVEMQQPGVGAVATTTSSRQLNFSLSAEMPLVDFGRGQLGVQIAREQVLSARAGLIAVEQGVLLQAVQAYLNLISARDTTELRRNNVDVIGQEVRAARERFELGDSTRTDVAIAEARLAAAESALSAAEGDFNVAREAFNMAVGRYPGNLRDAPRLPRLPSSLEAALAAGRRNHPSIVQAQHEIAAADLVVETAGRQRMGTVTGSLSAGMIAETGRTVGDVTASVTWGVPIYSGGSINSAERQAIARQEAARADLHQTVAQVHEAVSEAWAQLEVSRAQLAASDTQIEASRTAYESVRAEAEFGSRTTLDVLNAEQELRDAQANRIFASASVQLGAYALLEAMGQLTVEALNLGIPTYDVEAYSAAFSNARAPSGEPATRARSEQGDRLDRIMHRAPGNLNRGP
ncbi:MAG: type I secretion system outer membrane protein TolC [Rhodobacteraceae bacterium HLUCCA12]|nr:MAG: type I secretion system outer membrane protein TolC [Rhodobacteraceae bacterium HLUCCA12]